MALSTNPQDTTVAVFPTAESAREYAEGLGWGPAPSMGSVRVLHSEDEGGYVLIDYSGGYPYVMTLGDLPN